MFSKPLECHIFLQSWRFLPVAHVLWVWCRCYGRDLCRTTTSLALQPGVCGEPAEEQADMGLGGLGGGGPQGSSVSVCLHPSAHNSLLKETAAASPWPPTSHTSSSFAPFLLEMYAEGDSGKPSSTWPELAEQSEGRHCTLLRVFRLPYWRLLFWNEVTQKHIVRNLPVEHDI